MKRIITLIMILAIAATGCKKQGPQGPTGQQGPVGPQGPQGNANVEGGSVTVDFIWNASTSYGTADMTYNAITQDIVDFGAVLVYISNGSGGWIALPYTDYTASGISISYYFVYAVNTVRVYYSQEDLSNSAMPSSGTFKVVAISAAQKQSNPNTDWKNYDEVMTVLSRSATAAQ